MSSFRYLFSDSSEDELLLPRVRRQRRFADRINFERIPQESQERFRLSADATERVIQLVGHKMESAT